MAIVLEPYFVTKRIRRKFRASRALCNGKSLWGSERDPVHSRPYRPGQHGATSFPRISAYREQLFAKQRLKRYYGNITEKQFKKIYKEAARKSGDTGENFIVLLESRLDAFIYRCKYVPTVFAARQFVNHGHVLVNGKRVTIPSYVLTPGDVVEVRERSRNIEMYNTAVDSKTRDVPDYISVDGPKAVYQRYPTFSEVPYPVIMDPNLIIEYYSM